MSYRPDIDGLRAVAVASVLLYHLHISVFPGGYVGVDIFFVISGYLITQIILADLNGGRFSLVSFYERRIRRIFPALFVMLVGTSTVACIYLLPSEVEDFGKSLIAATFSLSNIYFWAQSGYFDAPASSKPLLHTWSLGVEEQFYLLYPLFLALLYRHFPRYLSSALIAAALTSFCASVYFMKGSPASSFFLSHLRAWELLLGSVVAIGVFPELSKKIHREMSSIVGAALIVYAVLTYTRATYFPGFAALVPCVGAALVLAAGRNGDSSVGRVLSLKPVVFFGLISYSLYLWHWPLIVFQNTNAIVVSGLSARITKVILVGLCVLLAWLSWKYVEAPLRSGPRKPTRPVIFKGALVGVLATTCLGVLALVLHGLPFRFSTDALEMAKYLQYHGKDSKPAVCFVTSRNKYEDFDKAGCLHREPLKSNYLLIGDSHAGHLWSGITSTLDINLMQATASGCKPTIDQHISASPVCSRLMDYIFTEYLPKNRVDKLLISAYWSEADLPALTRTIEWAKKSGIAVLLFGPIVVYDSPLPRVLATSIQKKNTSVVDEHRLSYVKTLDLAMKTMAFAEQIRYASLYEAICKNGQCRVLAENGIPLQYDYGHLTEEGSALLMQEFKLGGVFN